MSATYGFTKNPRYIRGKMWWQRHVWRIQQSGRFVASIVFVLLFLDNVLLTVIVPIVPDFLMKLDCNEFSSSGDDKKIEKCITAGTIPDAFEGNFTPPSWYERGVVYKNVSEENARIGLLFASKALVQLVANPIVGTLTNRIGYTTPLFVGSVILLISSLIFAFGDTFTLLFVARGIQGIASACISIAGMAMIADRYQDDKERSKVMGVTLGGIALGVLTGYPFGGILYDFVGKTTPMVILAVLITINSVLQLIFLRPRLEPERLLIGASVWKLFRDPYILLASGAICVSTTGIAALEVCLPVWLKEFMSPPTWQLGTVFIPDSLGYLLGTNMFGSVAYKCGRWLTAMSSLALVGVCAILIPFSNKMSQLLVPHFGLGLGIGITDAALMPLLAFLVDTRYVSLYGSVYAIAQVSVSLAYSLGPLFGGELVKSVGFPWIMRTIGILNLLYCPLCYFLKNPTPSEENKGITLKGPDGRHEPSAPEGRTLYSSFNNEK